MPDAVYERLAGTAEAYALGFMAAGAGCFATAPLSKLPPAGSRGVSDATSDPVELRRLIDRARHPGTSAAPNIALRYGQRFLVIEDDAEHQRGDGPLLELLAAVGLPSRTWEIGARRGHHRVYRLPEGVMELRKFTTASGIEVRTGNAYSLLPGSQVRYGEQGQVWTYIEPFPERSIAEISETAVDALLRLRREKARVTPSNAVTPIESAPQGDIIERAVVFHGKFLLEDGRNNVLPGLMHGLLAQGVALDDVIERSDWIADHLTAACPSDHPLLTDEVVHAAKGAFLRSDRAELVALAARIYEIRRRTAWRDSRPRVLDAMIALALKTGSPEFSASFRRLAELAGVGVKTVAKATQRLAAHGWITRHGGNRRGTTTWELLDPATARISGLRQEGNSREQYLVARHTRPTVSLSSQACWPADHDAFRYRALGQAGRTVLLALESAGRQLSAIEVAAVIKRDRRTAERHLARLAQVHLVVRLEDGWTTASGDRSALLNAAADDLNSTGTGDRQRRRHAVDRDLERRRKAAWTKETS